MLGLKRRFSPAFCVYLAIILLVLIPYGLRLWLLEIRQFDQDEFEHLHVAWLISKGQIPYRDFFEHHTPWLHLFLAPFYWFFDVETNSRDAVAFLFLARRLMWLFTGIILLLTFWLGKLWRNSLVGLVALLFLINTDLFLQASLEVRPDLLAGMFWLACLVALISAVRLEDSAGFKISGRFACSGMFVGAGLMATQKVFFVLPGLLVAMALYALIPWGQKGWAVRIRNIGFLAIGASVPILLTVGYFYVKGGLPQFLYYNVLFNARFKETSPLYPRLYQLIYSSPYLAFFGVLALSKALYAMMKLKLAARGDSILVPSTLGVIAGLFIIPVPYAQYYLLLLPLVALFAAAGVIEMIDALWQTREDGDRRKWLLSAAAYGVSILVFLSLISFTAGSPHPYFVVAFWFCTLSGAIIFLSRRQRSVALIFFFVMLSIPPFKRLIDVFDERNTDQINQIRYVIENTAPTDTFMDGFTGTALFRPHAYFFFCLTNGIQEMLSMQDLDELLANLRSGKIRPNYIIFDKNLRTLPHPITAFFSADYQPVGQGEIWRRRKISVMDRNIANKGVS